MGVSSLLKAAMGNVITNMHMIERGGLPIQFYGGSPQGADSACMVHFDAFSELLLKNPN